MNTSGARMAARPVVAIHGGAGTLSRAGATPGQQRRYRDALCAVLRAAQALLERGAPALDVVTEAVRLLEECPLFNAGRGAVYTADGRHELDACVMRGADLAVGAVAGVTRLRNPVLAARCVLEHQGPVLLIGEGAERFAMAHGCATVDPAWFGTPERLAQLQAVRAAAGEATALDHDGQRLLATATAPLEERGKFGTVGAVALDAQGGLAAATSTGGVTNKLPGRVGDSPLAGAGCYANDATVAVSCTGAGEAFIRGLAAHDLSARMAYGGLPLGEAAGRVVHEMLPPLGGRGGLIAVDRQGNVALPFNTEGMYRGWARSGAAPACAIYADEADGSGA
ncbi:isoaspartyl peptidase/L-asparaginase [Ramlibacter sp. H39-3-26]|uniref:isoaspartyl peptidase/L-asparaginase family protein n=1 Tax=Curvibacter soli TaxID=3031331 RepID=UPI0023DB9097|nr:isoaspartyl peptidase/L-asparaginase [Ramlibacter sp. H39-3-26]MDF1485500.1 isoaspartyl peptidase/L-asparaginase [Ramlibacter sp. H39-3-26]